MKQFGRVGVFMPTLNSDLYLVEAIRSVQEQTLYEYDLIIADGGSADETLEIANLFARKDNRIITYVDKSHPESRLNRIIQSGKYDYIITAHSDDVNLPNRFETQINYLIDNSMLAGCGCATDYWLHEKKVANIHQYSGSREYPVGIERIKARIPFWWCVSTASLAINTKKLKQIGAVFGNIFETAGDWAFYWSCAKVGAISNTSEVLLSYRHHLKSHGSTSLEILKNESRKIRMHIARDCGWWPLLDETEKQAYLELVIAHDIVISADRSARYDIVFEKIADHNKITNMIQRSELEAALKDYNQSINHYRHCSRDLDLLQNLDG